MGELNVVCHSRGATESEDSNLGNATFPTSSPPISLVAKEEGLPYYDGNPGDENSSTRNATVLGFVEDWENRRL